MFPRFFLSLSFLVICLPRISQADFDPIIGARAGIAAAEYLMASPPLPSLEDSATSRYSPQIGYTRASISGSASQGTSPTDLKYDGTLAGFSGGVGASWTMRGDISWFGMLIGSQLQGQVQATADDKVLTTLEGLKSQALGTVGGMSYRLYGNSNSITSLGIFAGPAFVQINSSFTNNAEGAPAPMPFELNTSLYGIYSGAQFKIRWGKLLLNPYVLYFADASEKCRAFQKGSFPNSFGDGCPDNSMSMTGSFLGYGVFVGYEKFRFNVYSQVAASNVAQDIVISNYSISYSF